MAEIRISCPHCSYHRDIPSEKVPDREVQVTCPKCGQQFPFSPTAKPATDSGNIKPVAVTSLSPASNSSVPLSSAQISEQQSTKPAPLILIALVLLVVVAIGLWLNFPQSSPVLKGAYADQKNHFAVKAPSDWMLVTPDNYQIIMEQYRDRIPNELAGMIGKGKPGFTVSYFRIPAIETEFSPNFNVVMLDTKGKNLPALTESEKNKAAEIASKEMSRQFKGYKMLESKIVQVDGIDSMQVVGEADLTIVTKSSQPIYSEPGAFGWRRITGHTEAEKQSYRMRALQTMIPGNKRAYVVSFMYDDLKTPEMESIQRQVLDTFRVLERPPRFGGITMGALNGGLIGAGLYLLGILLGRLFRAGET